MIVREISFGSAGNWRTNSKVLQSQNFQETLSKFEIEISKVETIHSVCGVKNSSDFGFLVREEFLLHSDSVIAALPITARFGKSFF